MRFVSARDASGIAWVLPDATGRLPGRGAYLLPGPRAIDVAQASGAQPEPALSLDAQPDRHIWSVPACALSHAQASY